MGIWGIPTSMVLSSTLLAQQKNPAAAPPAALQRGSGVQGAAAPAPSSGTHLLGLARFCSLADTVLGLGASLAAPERRTRAPPERSPRAHAAQHLDVSDEAGLKDVAAAMVLCEAVYRADDHGTEKAEVAIRRLQRRVPDAPRLAAVQWSPAGQEQQYVVAETPDAIFVAFLGTKRPADHMVNMRVRQTRVFAAGSSTTSASWGSMSRSSSTASSLSCLSSLEDEPSSSGGSSIGAEGSEEEAFEGAAAHSGYLRRAAAVPAEQLYQLATVHGKRLVLAGHSLGGAVATLCTLRLLAALPPLLHDTVTCVGFAVPPVGNAQLQAAATAAGWAQRISNYLLPEDWVPGLLGIFSSPQQPSSGGGGGSSSGFPPAGAGHECFCWGPGGDHASLPGAAATAPAAAAAA